MVIAKADRNVDPYTHIDRIREKIFDHETWMDQAEKRLKMLEDAERDRLTPTGAWKVVKEKLEDETIDWLKWALRGTAAALFMALLSGVGVLIRLAWERIHL